MEAKDYYQGWASNRRFGLIEFRVILVLPEDMSLDERKKICSRAENAVADALPPGVEPYIVGDSVLYPFYKEEADRAFAK